MYQSLHEDIATHQGPVLETIQEANQLLKQKGDKLSSDDHRTLQDTVADLKSRYENVSAQSSTRLSKLRFASDDLQKLEPEIVNLEDWLRGTEQRLDNSLKKIERDPNALRRQYEEQKALAEEVLMHAADVKFVNMTGSAFTHNAKVIYNLDHFHLFRWPVRNFRNDQTQQTCCYDQNLCLIWWI